MISNTNIDYLLMTSMHDAPLVSRSLRIEARATTRSTGVDRANKERRQA
jgi:hypothetical protein